MSKLWDKGYAVDTLIEKFTVGEDFILDKNLIFYDCIGSIAHAQMLQSIGILKTEEYTALKNELQHIIASAKKGTFTISPDQEDVHTAIENHLTNVLGEAGKKIHTCRSRNDQVLVDLRMYMRDQLLTIMTDILQLCTQLTTQAQKYEFVPLVGRTHFQKAMLSSCGVLFGAYAESLLDNFELLKNAYALINQCPLGSGASYGVTLHIDRQLTSDLLGFKKVQNNVLYANNSRGKMESIVMHTYTQIMIDLSKIATDLILFSSPEFGYFSLPSSLCSGSSLMPQKKNPCGLELIRAKSGTVLSSMMQVLTIIRGLPSGYNRDFQETKKPLMESCNLTSESLRVCAFTIQNIIINQDSCYNAITPEVYATDEALRATEKGIPFRDIYKKIGTNLDAIALEDPIRNLTSKKHLGAPGNLGLNYLADNITQSMKWVKKTKENLIMKIEKLLA